MSVTTSGRLTLGEVLFGTDDAHDALRRDLHERAALGAIFVTLQALAAGTRAAVVDGATDQIARALDIDLIQVLSAGWSKYMALVDAGRRTLTTPGSEEILDLVDHRIASTYTPSIDISVDEVKVARIDLRIDAGVDLHGLSAVVARGRVTALRSGRASIHAGLEVDGVHIAAAEREVDLHLHLALGSGIVVVVAPGGPGVPVDQPTALGT